MNIGEIVKDALAYPFSDYKKILILGIIMLVGNLSIGQLLGTINALLGTNNVAVVIILLGIIGLVCIFLARGYQFRIISSSLNGAEELPKFINWIEMIKDGIKVFTVTVIYLIPVILITSAFISSFVTILAIILSNLPSLVTSALIGGGINTLISTHVTSPGIGFLITLLYMMVVTPISLISIANMANNNSKLVEAFKFREIFNKIAIIGWKNLIIWYVTTGFVFLILSIVGLVINGILGVIYPIAGTILTSLIILSYIYMYLYRSVALLYTTNKE
jgi:hypothetical protein